jgi:hypothetical protein
MEYSIRETPNTKTYHWTQPFVLTGDDVERLCNALQGLVGPIAFEAECDDGKTREFASLVDLLKFENPPNKRINAVWLTASPSRGAMKLGLLFDSKLSSFLSVDGNIFLRVEGTDDDMVAAHDLIEEHLVGMKPWYKTIAGCNLPKMILLVSGMLLWFLIPYGLTRALDKEAQVVASMLVRFPGIAYLPSESIAVVFEFLLLLAIPIVIVLLPAKIFNWIREWAFPTGVIALAQGAKRHAHKEILRIAVAIAFSVSLVASLVAAWFLRPESRASSPSEVLYSTGNSAPLK